MDNIFIFYFETFDEILRDKFGGKVTPEFKKLITETKIKLKATFTHSAKHYEYCVIIDVNFDKYIKDTKEMSAKF